MNNEMPFIIEEKKGKISFTFTYAELLEVLEEGKLQITLSRKKK